METKTISGLTFEVYSLEGTDFKDVPGVYVIFTSEKWLDVGETDKLGSRLADHERKPCWQRNSGGLKIWVAFREISSQQERLSLEDKLRNKLNPACGEE